MADRRQRTQPEKKTKPKKKRRMSGKTWFFLLFFTVVIAIVCGIIGYSLIILNGERMLKERADMMVMGEASIVYDANGDEISRLSTAGENREIAEYDEIPKEMMNALVATEDQRFYEHSGIDFFAIGRALVKDVIARSAVEGGSTITQQLAKNMFLSSDKTLFRKATEASIAVALENNKTKEEILTLYLNRIYFGKGVYGVKGAAKYYFNSELKDLKLWQMATLAGMPKAPSRYNPVNDPEGSKVRRGVVLQLMYDQGYITKDEMDEAKAVDYVTPPSVEQSKDEPYKAFVDYAVEEALRVMPDMTETDLRIGGYRIYTTLNPTAQTVVEKEFADDSNFEESVDDKKVQGAMVIIDHRDGAIQAIAGGRDYERKGLNRVELPRQPGSAFKPITSYGPALETGQYFPWTVLKNDKTCFGNYCPKDSRGATPITMQDAVKHSRNLPAVWTLNEIGVSNGVKFATKLGFKLSDQDRNLAIALGGLTEGVTPLQMATAYSAFANNGQTVDSHTIREITTSSNTAVYTYKAPSAEQVMNPDSAWYMTEMLQTVVQSGGTGTGAAIDRPVAGKTGTTQHGIPGFNSSANRDAWFVGYTPEWTAAVWMGYDRTDEQHVLKKSSAQSAAMFSKVMKQAMADIPKSSFKKPEGVKEPVKDVGAVTNFNAVFVPEQMKVALSWQGAASSSISYKVYRKAMDQADFSLFVDSAGTSVDDMSVAPGMTYDYYVVAIDAENNLTSKQSETITVQIPETVIDVPDVPMDSIDPDEGGIELPSFSPDSGMTPTPTPGTQTPPVETIDPGTVSPEPTDNLASPPVEEGLQNGGNAGGEDHPANATPDPAQGDGTTNEAG
ncbi:PBP1A family penicillin-binding protein [Paenibacillus sp. KS-LC4]|uniref:transglycosylase domain-containing protein n=1 Tax=Paenibacillus sp. KS-LC4 TaxID=2979727 RepID=UPI0030D0155F